MSSAEFTPPMLHGVSASKVFLKPSAASICSIYDYLCVQFPHIDAAEWQQRFRDGLIYDANGTKLLSDSLFQANSHVFYYRFLKHEIHVPFEHEILFENDDLIVVDKPHFLTMSPTGQYVQETLLVRLKNQTGIEQLTPIHRLDRETAGVVLVSKRPETRGIYQQMFAERKVQKTYHAIAPYTSDIQFPLTLRLHMDKGEPFYTMQVKEAEANTETEIHLLAHNDQWAKYLLKPHTGKQHQLRVHLNHLGLPIQNDAFYPCVAHKADNDFSSPLQLLAKQIEFIDPVLLKPMNFSSKQELNL
ncbi:pseudouridine synthase [Acinetobacter sp. ANC 3813]|uniref:pseudouridine synthase n=1 Tax=Acinetobacter sp. ANC 3813 TaxID=1977873 RepID=UPI000A3303F4|nr:pseudouridine synthase [Acinetobacter sp. ANC 3813]OTG88512.1 pseudouridylate synthase [Acinetobacter sp. ANC 3813]